MVTGIISLIKRQKYCELINEGQKNTLFVVILKHQVIQG
jgi:hypothetical protein